MQYSTGHGLNAVCPVLRYCETFVGAGLRPACENMTLCEEPMLIEWNTHLFSRDTARWVTDPLASPLELLVRPAGE